MWHIHCRLQQSCWTIRISSQHTKWVMLQKSKELILCGKVLLVPDSSKQIKPCKPIWNVIFLEKFHKGCNLKCVWPFYILKCGSLCTAVWCIQILESKLQILRWWEPNWFWGVVKWFSQPPQAKEKQHQANKLITVTQGSCSNYDSGNCFDMVCAHVSQFSCGKNHNSCPANSAGCSS